MIRATIGSKEITFSADDSTRTASIAFQDHPGVFDHPRHLFADPDKASDAIRPILRSFSRWGFPPKVSFRIDRFVEGGITQVDLRAIKDAFMHAGARDIQHEKG
jgi:hypothetical protein